MPDKKAEILALLEQGEITATEAFTMLNQLNETPPEPDVTQDTPHSNGPKPPEFDTPPLPPPPQYTAPDWVEDLVGDISGAVQDVVEGIKDMNIGATVNEFFSGTYGHYENTVFFTSAPVTQGILKLSVIGKGAKVTVYGYDGDTIRVQCKYNARRPDTQVLFSEADGVYQVMYDESLMRTMEIACEVPYKSTIKSAHFASKNGAVLVDGIQAETLVLYTKNEKIQVGNIHCAELVAQNRNAQIRVATATAQNIHVETTNSKIQMDDVRANNGQLKTTNSAIKLAFVDVDHLKLYTTNTSLKLDKLLYELPAGDNWDSERTLEAHTTNSSIVFAAPPDIGVKVDARTTNGKIVCKRGDMYFAEMGQNHAHGASSQYDFSARKIHVGLYTTNASVKIRE